MGWLCCTTRGVVGEHGWIANRTVERERVETYDEALDWLERQGRAYAAVKPDNELEQVLSLIEAMRTRRPQRTGHGERTATGEAIAWAIVPEEADEVVHSPT